VIRFCAFERAAEPRCRLVFVIAKSSCTRAFRRPSALFHRVVHGSFGVSMGVPNERSSTSRSAADVSLLQAIGGMILAVNVPPWECPSDVR
jgi:hypothetical protein